MVSEGRGEAQQNVGVRADFQRDRLVPDLGYQLLVLEYPDAVPDSSACPSAGLPDAGGARGFSGVMGNMQPGRPGCPEDVRERVCGVCLVSGQADGDHALPRMGFGQPQRLPGTLHRTAPGVIQQQLHLVIGLPDRTERP